MKTIGLLIKPSAYDKEQIKQYYLNLLPTWYINVRGFPIAYNEKGKAPVSLIKETLPDILEECKKENIDFLMITSAEYFKYLTKKRKVTFMHGEITQCVLPGYEHINVIYILNYQSLFYAPERIKEIHIACNTITNFINKNIHKTRKDFIHKAHYPSTFFQITSYLEALLQYPLLTCDVESHSLVLGPLKTIAFGISKHEAIALPIDDKVLSLLRKFFVLYPGYLIFHNATFDIKQLIFNCFMNQRYENYTQVIKGLDAFFPRIHDTKIITYLANNSTSRISLKLKDNIFEYTGNYSEEIVGNFANISLKDLLEYNLVDALGTFYLFEKEYQNMVNDQQKDIYYNLMLPSIRNITNMELIGAPLNPDAVKNANDTLILERDNNLNKLFNTKAVQDYQKEHTAMSFNSSSTIQKVGLIYGLMSMPVNKTTATKQPSTDADALEELLVLCKTDPINYHPDAPVVLETLKNLNVINQTLSTFIKVFEEKSITDNYKNTWLHGNFNIGGTVSGRESSNNPNLQNIPTSSLFAKIVKQCFQAPPGWIMCGADFNGLEDRISALTTKDPNKLRVFESGYDGHCLRAFYYFGDQMPDIVETVSSINSIADKYPDLRQDSKSPTFALTYKGTWKTLVKKFGFTEPFAKDIVSKYHEMYKISDEWVEDQLKCTLKHGYVDVAFGLRIRTPTLQGTSLGLPTTPYFIEKDYKTCANVLGQSYGLLNNRAANEFSERLRQSPYLYDVKPILHIHDAQYYLVRKNAEIITWVNKNLIECMEWQELPEIKHPEVKLGGKLELFYPSWYESTSIPNNASESSVKAILDAF